MSGPRGLDRDASRAAGTRPEASVTRGFLFADLRGYTAFTDARGAGAAAELLGRYRLLVRAAIARFAGAEIRTEGDSFYVVFNSVSAAVRCALAIAEAARVDNSQATEPIRVGIGIHAGETVETADGYVGAPVNLAARICSQARPGEVLVSDTVRALTRTVLDVRFEPRGRPHLKGVAEPVALFAVTPATPGAVRQASTTGRFRSPPRRRTVLMMMAAAITLVLVAALGWAAFRPAGPREGPWRIAVAMPVTGEVAEDPDIGGIAMRNAARLAFEDSVARGTLSGTEVELIELDSAPDEAVAFEARPSRPVIQRVVDDPRVVALIGPWSSALAEHEIPITNAAGLLQCSPTASTSRLTKPRNGSLDLRPSRPDANNFVRLVAADDINATAMADFARRDLVLEHVLVVDDTFPTGRSVADAFERAFREEGGTVTRRALNEDADPTSVLEPLAMSREAPGALFFGGFTETGAARLRQAMADGGFGTLPFLSWDGVFDGPGTDDHSFIGAAGAAAASAYLAHSGVPPPLSAFIERYRGAYGDEPGEYAGAAHACMEVIIDAVRAVAGTDVDGSEVREAVRAYAVDPGHRFETVLGSIAFDRNGDSTRQFVTFYRVDMTAAEGQGDWVVARSRDYAPVP